VRETAEDVARTLACYHRVLCARVFDHHVLLRMAAALGRSGFDVPIVNLLSDTSHPCQAVADVITMREALDRLPDGLGPSDHLDCRIHSPAAGEPADQFLPGRRGQEDQAGVGHAPPHLPRPLQVDLQEARNPGGQLLLKRLPRRSVLMAGELRPFQ